MHRLYTYNISWGWVGQRGQPTTKVWVPSCLARCYKRTRVELPWMTGRSKKRRKDVAFRLFQQQQSLRHLDFLQLQLRLRWRLSLLLTLWLQLSLFLDVHRPALLFLRAAMFPLEWTGSWFVVVSQEFFLFLLHFLPSSLGGRLCSLFKRPLILILFQWVLKFRHWRF